jgi:hypothetical protein
VKTRYRGRSYLARYILSDGRNLLSIQENRRSRGGTEGVHSKLPKKVHIQEVENEILKQRGGD